MDLKSLWKLLILSSALLWAEPCFAGDILVLSTNSAVSPSHHMALSTVAGGLVSRGHNVTLVTSDVKGTTGFPNGTFSQVLYFKASYLKDDADEAMDDLLHEAIFASLGLYETYLWFDRIMKENYISCLDLWRDRRLVERLKTSRFDLILVFPFSSCDVLMAHYAGVDFAVVFSSIRIPLFHEGYLGMPCPSSYVPFDTNGILTDEMSFFERLQNLATPFAWEVSQYLTNSHYYDIQVEYGIHPDKSIRELYSGASLFLSHASLESDFPRPYTPNVIQIGGLISQPSKPLQNDMKEFVEGSGDHGVIIFTLGSVVKGLSNKDIADTFARVFSKLPQRVLWRHNAEPPKGLGNNTKLVKWLPQNDLLGHPKTRLLIYHGGSNGVLEAISHGVPMVIIPLFADQFTHAARVQKKGMGMMLDKENITEQSLTEVIEEVLYNPSYTERAQHFSNIFHDAPMTPLERAVYWIEHVMKFGGDHLRPRSADMNFIELYMIDVIVFLIVVCLIGSYIDYVIMRQCYRKCCGEGRQKYKSE